MDLARADRAVKRFKRRYGDLPRAYAASAIGAVWPRGRFNPVRTYCTFLGNPRSGSTLVGSLLDAHPDALIAHELNALRFMHHHFSRRQIYALILANERAFTQSGRSQFGYDYRVEGGWHGRYRELLVIGDKRADGTARYLKRFPDLLDRLLNDFPDPRFVHVVRNPYDNIVTLAKRRGRSLEDAARGYFKVCSLVEGVREKVGRDRVIDVGLEAMIADPVQELTRLFGFLDIEAAEDHLERSARAVFASAKITRSQLPWTPGLVDRVAEDSRRFSFLDGYSFTS